MSIARRLLLGSTYLPMRAFERDAAHPERAQARVWQETWRTIGQAPFWRHRASSRSTPPLSAFPLTGYDDYRAALEESFEQETSTLSGEEILFWSQSAGSTGPRKLFPITRTYRRQFQSTTPPFLAGLARTHPGLLTKPVLYFAGSMPQEKSPAAVEVGFISNFNYRTVPAFLRRLYAFPVEVLRDTETFFRWGPLYALATDLSAMVGISPAILTRFFEGLVERWDLYAPILEGRAAPPTPLPSVKVSPGRLALLRSIMRRQAAPLQALWPSLQSVVCWKSSTCGLQLPALKRWLPDVPYVDATYSATEGWINVPRADGSVGGPVHPGAHVFEFLPLGSEAGADDLLPLWALEPGGEYEIVLTTAMGLVRYRLRDVVVCTGHFHRAPIIRFAHKGDHQISLGPACVSEAELVTALAGAPGDRTAWLVAPSASGQGLELCIGNRDPAPSVAEVQASLEAINPLYKKYVADGTLSPISLRRLAPDHPALIRGDEHAQTKPRLLVQEPVA